MRFLEVILPNIVVKLLRDETGQWLLGFTHHIIHKMALLAELGYFRGNHVHNKIIE